MDGQTLLALQELLNPPSAEQGSHEVYSSDCVVLHATVCGWVQELDAASPAYSTPGGIGQPAAVAQATRVQDEGDIWNKTEVSEQQQYEYDDPRPQPE